MIRSWRVVVFGLVVLAMAWTSNAQHLDDILPSLIGAETVINAVGNLPGIGHTAHFEPDAAQQTTPLLINDALKSQVPTFPVGSSSGGFTYVFDPAIGTATRSSSSFGPSFAERALTNGRGRWNLGFNYQHTNYEKFANQPLEGGNIKFYVKHNDCCPGQNPVTGARPGPPSYDTPNFEADLIQEDLTANITSDIGTFFATVGVTDRFDVSVTIPVVHVAIDAHVDQTLLRLGSASSADPTIHRFIGGDGTHQTISKAGDATGIGDVQLRAKYVAVRTGSGGLAAAVDVRFPTGNEQDLLGTGKTSGKVYLIASGGTDRVAPHVNFGYTFGGINDEINYVGGLDGAVSKWLTASFDVVGRTLRDTEQVESTDVVFNPNPPAGVTSITRSQFGLLGNGNLNLLLGAAGVKVNVGKTLLITANVLFPLNDNGLKPGVTPVIGVDYSF